MVVFVAVDECRNEMVDRVARYRFDQCATINTISTIITIYNTLALSAIVRSSFCFVFLVGTNEGARKRQ